MPLTRKVNENNMFARVTNFVDLDERVEMMLSPENLYADGERSRTQAQALAKRINKDAEERRNELVFA